MKRLRRWSLRGARATPLVLLVACDRAPPTATSRSAPPVSEPAPKPNACAGGGGTISDSTRAPWFARTLSGLCIAPHAEVRSFGADAKAPLGAACEVLEGDCARYARYGLRRVLVVPYVVAVEPRARVSVTLLELASSAASYALFSERILGDSDELAPFELLDGVGTAARSDTKALAWRANHLAVLDYTDETSAPGRATQRGAAALEALARDLLERLPGKTDVPPSVARLPLGNGGPLEARFEHEDLFGIVGLGSGATARYDVDGKSFPLAVLARDDEDAAKDVLRTLRRLPGARSKKGAPYEALAVPFREREEERRVEWLFGRKRNVVLGVGREPEKLDRHGETRARHAHMLRLKSLLDDLR